MLRGHGLTQNVTVPVSAGLLTDTAAYFASLTAYREGDPRVDRRAARRRLVRGDDNGRQLVRRPAHDPRAGRDDRARRDSAAWRVADLLLRQPVIDAAAVASELGIEPRNAQRVIAPLAEPRR